MFFNAIKQSSLTDSWKDRQMSGRELVGPKGQFKYYVISILAFFDPTHPPTLSSNFKNKPSKFYIITIIWLTPLTQSLENVIFEWSLLYTQWYEFSVFRYFHATFDVLQFVLQKEVISTSTSVLKSCQKCYCLVLEIHVKTGDQKLMQTTVIFPTSSRILKS